MKDRVRQYALPFEVRKALGEEDFVVGQSNQAAVAWIDRWPDWPAPGIVLSGPPASGKSHLVSVWRHRTGAVVCRDREMEGNHPERLLSRGALAIDDLDSVDEQRLFRVLSGALDGEVRVLLVSRVPPARMNLGLRDLQSRLSAMPNACLGPPDDELLAGVLRKHFADRGVRVGQGVVGFLVRRMERSFATAQTVAAELDVAALRAHRKITVPFVRAWFERAESGT